MIHRAHARGQRHTQIDGQSKRMKRRQHSQQPVVGGDIHHRQGRAQIGQHIGVGQRHRLGNRLRAAGEQNGRHRRNLGPTQGAPVQTAAHKGPQLVLAGQSGANVLQVDQTILNRGNIHALLLDLLHQRPRRHHLLGAAQLQSELQVAPTHRPIDHHRRALGEHHRQIGQTGRHRSRQHNSQLLSGQLANSRQQGQNSRHQIAISLGSTAHIGHHHPIGLAPSGRQKGGRQRISGGRLDASARILLKPAWTRPVHPDLRASHQLSRSGQQHVGHRLNRIGVALRKAKFALQPGQQFASLQTVQSQILSQILLVAQIAGAAHLLQMLDDDLTRGRRDIFHVAHRPGPIRLGQLANSTALPRSIGNVGSRRRIKIKGILDIGIDLGPGAPAGKIRRLRERDIHRTFGHKKHPAGGQIFKTLHQHRLQIRIGGGIQTGATAPQPARLHQHDAHLGKGLHNRLHRAVAAHRLQLAAQHPPGRIQNHIVALAQGFDAFLNHRLDLGRGRLTMLGHGGNLKSPRRLQQRIKNRPLHPILIGKGTHLKVLPQSAHHNQRLHIGRMGRQEKNPLGTPRRHLFQMMRAHPIAQT